MMFFIPFLYFFFCIENISISLSAQLLALSHFCKVSKRLFAGSKGKTCPFWHFGKSFIPAKNLNTKCNFFNTSRFSAFVNPSQRVLSSFDFASQILVFCPLYIALETWWALESFCYCMHVLCLHCKGRENFNFVRRFYWRTGRPTDCRRPGEEIRFILRYGFYQIPGSEIRFLNELRFLSKAR